MRSQLGAFIEKKHRIITKLSQILHITNSVNSKHNWRLIDQMLLLYMLWQWHVRNLHFHFCQLGAVKIYLILEYYSNIILQYLCLLFYSIVAVI